MGKVVLAISGSQRPKSFSDKMLDLCIEGMGGDLEIHKFQLHRMTIGPCNSCMICWTKTPGRCAQNDDFSPIAEAYLRADYLLLATPLYFFSFPAPVKNVIDRFFAFIEPAQLPAENGGTRHPIRGDRHPKTVLISSCGFPELDNFDLLRALFRKICDGMGWVRAGKILVPAAGAANAPKLFDRKLDLVRQAGSELAAGAISPETTSAIAEPVMSAEDYRAMCTARFSGILGKAKAAAIAVKAMHKPHQAD